MIPDQNTTCTATVGDRRTCCMRSASRRRSSLSGNRGSTSFVARRSMPNSGRILPSTLANCPFMAKSTATPKATTRSNARWTGTVRQPLTTFGMPRLQAVWKESSVSPRRTPSSQSVDRGCGLTPLATRCLSRRYSLPGPRDYPSVNCVWPIDHLSYSMPPLLPSCSGTLAPGVVEPSGQACPAEPISEISSAPAESTYHSPTPRCYGSSFVERRARSFTAYRCRTSASGWPTSDRPRIVISSYCLRNASDGLGSSLARSIISTYRTFGTQSRKQIATSKGSESSGRPDALNRFAG